MNHSVSGFASATTERTHVLVVDDEPHVGRIIQMKLEQGPFRVTLAYDGIQALEALDREGDLKVVWLDLMMPHVSGLEVLARMRANDRTKEIPCVILTAAGHDTQRDRAMTLGATDFMTKPFSPKRLLHRTAELAGVNVDPDSRAAREPGEGAPSGSFAMLAVTDTGHGMDTATLQRMWEPFFTTKPSGQGTGLGLASVYGSAKQSGGFVWADSEPERGTSVQVYWPQVRSAPEPLVEASGELEIRGGNETVLIVEDESLVRALLVRALRSHGYGCLEARDASEALRMLEQNKAAVDLVITDVVMPGMSGGGLGDRLALLRPDLPVLYTSAYVDEDVIGRGLLEEGLPFLQKPCTPRELARKVREVLDGAASARDEAETGQVRPRPPAIRQSGRQA